MTATHRREASRGCTHRMVPNEGQLGELARNAGCKRNGEKAEPMPMPWVREVCDRSSSDKGQLYPLLCGGTAHLEQRDPRLEQLPSMVKAPHHAERA